MHYLAIKVSLVTGAAYEPVNSSTWPLVSTKKESQRNVHTVGQTCW